MQDVLIVGGGVVGLSLARALARVGAAVTLLERAAAAGPHAEAGSHADDASDGGGAGDAAGAPQIASVQPCGGASALPVALLNPWRGRKGAAHADDRAGLVTTWRWADELTAEGLNPGAERDGVLRVATSERQARTWQERAAAEPTLTWRTPDTVPDGVHAPFGALEVRNGGQLQADAWRTALAASARAHGAQVRAASDVTRLERTPFGWRAMTRAGEDEEARHVVLALGADAPPEVAGADGPAWPDWIRTRGEEIAVAASAGPPMPVAGAIYAASAGARTWIGGGHRPADREDPEAPTKLRAALAWSVPGVAQAPIQAVWTGVRAKRADARPDIRRWREGLWIVGAFAGRGFLCAALEAERLADAWRAGEL